MKDIVKVIVMMILNDIKVEIENRSYGVANDSVIQGEIYERQAVLAIIDKYIDRINKEGGKV